MSLQNNLTLDILKKAEEGGYGIVAQTWWLHSYYVHANNADR